MKLLISLLTAALLGLAMPAWAQLSREGAAAVAQSMTGGRVLAVESYEASRRLVWRVKVLTPQGIVKIILIDPATGRAL